MITIMLLENIYAMLAKSSLKSLDYYKKFFNGLESTYVVLTVFEDQVVCLWLSIIYYWLSARILDWTGKHRLISH